MPQDSPHEFVFFIDILEDGEREALIRGNEHHHLHHVLKIASGQEVFVTDGRGGMYRGRVREVGREQTRVEILARHPLERPARSVTLALGRIRKDRFEAAVEQCTELGVARFVPFHSSKCRHHPYSENFIKRLKRIMQAAVKQSFQASIPAMEQELDFDGLLELTGRSLVAVVGECGAPPLGVPLRDASVLVIIGPEGGFVREERDALAQRGAMFASIGPTRLRSETAAVSLTSQILLVTD